MVTARGWEELSQMIGLCEEQNIRINADLVSQYLASDKICHSFINYYNVFSNIATQEELETILKGTASEELQKRFSNKSFDIRCAVIWMLSSRLQKDIFEYCTMTKTCDGLHQVLKQVDATKPLGDQLKVQKRFDESEWTSYAPSEDELVERTLKKFRSSVRGMNSQAGFEKVKKSFYDMVHQREQLRDQANDEITHVLDFISRVFGENSEMEILLNSLNTSESAIRLMAETGNPTYLDHKKNIFGGLSKASLNRKMKKEA